MPPRDLRRVAGDAEMRAKMAAQAADMEAQRELATAAQLDGRRRAMLEAGGMGDYECNDTSGCPCCGIDKYADQAWKPEKVHCGGRDPYAAPGTMSACVILGDHMHARCPRCSYSWLERAKFDTHRLAARGALRYDEIILGVGEAESVIAREPQPTLLSEWGYVEPEVKAS